MQIILTLILALIPGFALGFIISTCHIKKYGGEQKDKSIVYPCLLIFGGMPTILFLIQIKGLLTGNFHAPYVALSIGLLIGMFGTYLKIQSR